MFENDLNMRGGEIMEFTESNKQTAEEILKILQERNCTVTQSNEILAFVRQYIANHAKVQFDKLIEYDV